MHENNDVNNNRSASEQEEITRDDGDDHNTAQQGASIADSATATALSSNGAPTAPNMEQETTMLDSDKFNDDTQTVINIAQNAATSIVSQDVRETLPMDSESSQQHQQPEATPVGDENIMNNDNKDGDVDIPEKNATATMISPVLPPDQMVTDSSSVSITATSEPQPTEEAVYVNHGLAAWEVNRQRWLQARPSNEEEDDGGHRHSPTTTQQQQRHAKQINVDEIIDAIFTSHKAMLSTTATNAMNGGNTTGTALSSSSNMTAPFPQSVPLPQMIDILQDLWEAESL